MSCDQGSKNVMWISLGHGFKPLTMTTILLNQGFSWTMVMCVKQPLHELAYAFTQIPFEQVAQFKT